MPKHINNFKWIKFDKHKPNLQQSPDDKLIRSYNSIVGKVFHNALIVDQEYFKYSNTTTRHISYAAGELNLTIYYFKNIFNSDYTLKCRNIIEQIANIIIYNMHIYNKTTQSKLITLRKPYRSVDDVSFCINKTSVLEKLAIKLIDHKVDITLLLELQIQLMQSLKMENT